MCGGVGVGVTGEFMEWVRTVYLGGGGVENYVCRGVHRVTDLEKFPVRVSKDEAPGGIGVIGCIYGMW